LHGECLDVIRTHLDQLNDIRRLVLQGQ
jgi:hypothetical protein